MEKISTCKVRQDIIDLDLEVPVGDTYVKGGTYKYKWEYDEVLNADIFLILLGGSWQNACSIDFEFD